MANRFEGKKALITGGTSGFGLDAAKVIAAEGGRVAVTGHSDDHLQEARDALPDRSLVLKNDAADPAAAKVLREEIEGHFGSLDLLWLNAGYGKFQKNDANDADFFDDVDEAIVLQRAQGACRCDKRRGGLCLARLRECGGRSHASSCRYQLSYHG